MDDDTYSDHDNHHQTSRVEPVGDLPVGHRFSDQLEREWQRLRFDRRSLRRVNDWGVIAESVGDLDEVLIASGGRCRRLSSEHAGVWPDDRTADRVLSGLVALGAHDDLAARIVLQRILPALLMLTRARLSRGLSTGHLEDLVGAAWIVIRTFDPQRRPSCLAAALVRSTEHIAYKAAERRRSATEIVVDTERLPIVHQQSGPNALEELATLVTELHLDADDRQLITELLETGSTEIVALRHGVTARTIRNRRSAMVTRIREAMPAV